MNSSLASEVRPGAVGICSTGTSRRPLLPTTTAIAPAAYSAGTLSAAGEALHRLPASEQRPWICVEPIRSSASTTPGQALFMPACSSTTAPGVAAPTTKPPPSSRMPMMPGIFLVSTIRSGFSRPDRICTRRSVPPDRTFARPEAPANSLTASSTVEGAA